VLVLSDVVGSPLEAIGSGPCAPDFTTFAQAWAVLERYNLWDEVPAAVRTHLEGGLRGEVAETPKASDSLFERVQHTIVADNRTAALAAVERARAMGLSALVLTTYLEGEAREAGRFLAALAKEETRHGQPLPRPACLVLGGETTVTVRGGGQGGRNQEAALAAALALDGWEGVMVITLATDGTDGPTDAAGAIVTGETIGRARSLGLDAADYLARNDAYTFFDLLGDLLQTGPTGTNVNDLAFVLIF
jgi:glycerate 2-kinase